ncbi:MAG TPA: C40 family peptidase [Actinomycetota bacterium]|jgi:cell wall-associated NlpC family hydrolase|nr:C40 family peptidase [Actinomycetota bacterium]
MSRAGITEGLQTLVRALDDIRGQLNKLTPLLDRARIVGLYIRQALEQLPFAPRGSAPALALSVSTLVIGVALVLVRTGGPTEPVFDEQYLAAGASVSMQAFELPPLPTAAPQIRPAASPSQPITRVVFPTSRLTRSQGIRAAVSTAHKLIGKPYRWGASGPNAFDCSGLTSFVWRAAGLHLPHSSVGQYNSLPRVSLSNLQPGDILFSRWHGGGHVGIYIGGGRMISAPQTGRRVEISALRGHTIGAVRPALLLREDQGEQS